MRNPNYSGEAISPVQSVSYVPGPYPPRPHPLPTLLGSLFIGEETCN
jgi:hypothetical protein